MRILIAVLTIAFVLLLVAVALLNHEESVRLNLGEGSGQIAPERPLPWVLVGATMAGVLFMGLVSVLEGLHLRLTNGRLRRQLRRLQEELEDLRGLSLSEVPASPGTLPPPSVAASPSPAPEGPGEQST
jgi:uncharacterized integral membrane protein